jgi:hypothetical protein
VKVARNSTGSRLAKKFSAVTILVVVYTFFDKSMANRLRFAAAVE